MTEIRSIDYDSLAAEFTTMLLDKLRQHSVSIDFLELWVPDADPLKGILGMADSARMAGEPGIEIRFKAGTVPAGKRESLLKGAREIGDADLLDDGGVSILRIRSFRDRVAAGAAKAKPAKRESWSPEKLSATAKVARPAAGSAHSGADANLLPEFADLHPVYRAAAARTIAAIRHEGPLAIPPGGIRIEAAENGVVLDAAIDPKTHTVAAIAHRGATTPALRAILEAFCATAAGTPLQDAAEHAGLRVLTILQDPDRPPPRPGIVLPDNSDPPFRVPVGLIRRIRDVYVRDSKAQFGENFFQPPPAARWQGWSDQQREDAVRAEVAGYARENGLGPDALQFGKIIKNRYGHMIRVVMHMGGEIPFDSKPGTLRALERRLRERIETTLEVISEKMKDQSPLRRLS